MQFAIYKDTYKINTKYTVEWRKKQAKIEYIEYKRFTQKAKLKITEIKRLLTLNVQHL
jgi:hypothetical protein